MANETDEKAPELMAGEDTMTVYGMTVRQIVDGGAKDAERYAAGIQAKDQLIGELNETISAKNAEINERDETINAHLDTIENLKLDLGASRLAVQQAKTAAPAPMQSMQRLPNGGVRVLVTLDQDTAVPLLSQAEQAGEDPAKYIATQLGEALLAYTSS